MGKRRTVPAVATSVSLHHLRGLVGLAVAADSRLLAVATGRGARRRWSAGKQGAADGQ
jgi:hypothetical protein